MAKKKIEKPGREFTKRQLSRWQQQKRRQRIIFGSAILVIVAVLAIVGVGVYQGWYVEQYRPLHETVIEVNGTEFDMEYFIEVLEYFRDVQGVPDQYLEMITPQAITTIEDSELMRQAAMELGITVSDEEVDEGLESIGLPPSRVNRDMLRTQMLSTRLLEEYFEQQVPEYAEQRHVMAMFLESESQANEVRDRLEAGEDFATLAGELSLDATTKEAGGDLGWVAEGVLYLKTGSSILEENAFDCELGVLSQPIYEDKAKTLGYWLIEVVSRDDVAERAQVKMILLGSEEEAIEVRDRLEAGEDFATLVSEFSQHDVSKASGGQLEVSSEGMISPTFYDFVFDPETEVGVLSQPIRDEGVSTTGGYWLMEVVDVDSNRLIEEEDRDLLKQSALSQWVEALREDPDNIIQNYLDDEKKQWAIAQVRGG